MHISLKKTLALLLLLAYLGNPLHAVLHSSESCGGHDAHAESCAEACDKLSERHAETDTGQKCALCLSQTDRTNLLLSSNAAEIKNTLTPLSESADFQEIFFAELTQTKSSRGPPNFSL